MGFIDSNKMNKFTLKIKNWKEINQKLNKDKKEICSQKVYNPVLKCNFVNATTINFRGTHSKLFRHPSVQLKRLENWLPKTINIPKKRLAQKPKIKKVKKVKETLTQRVKITKKAFKSLKGCYVFIWCHHRNSKGTYVRSALDPEMWDYVKMT